MLSKNFLKRSSFCVLGASFVSLVQNSVGFTDNNQSLITKNETLQSSAGNKDLVNENLKLKEKQEKNSETGLQKAKVFKTLEEWFIDCVNDEEFKGFWGKVCLAFELIGIIPTYLTLKVTELLRLVKWPEMLASVGLFVIECIFQPFFCFIVLLAYAFVFSGLCAGLKYLGQKSKEGISNLINAINNSPGNTGDAA